MQQSLRTYTTSKRKHQHRHIISNTVQQMEVNNLFKHLYPVQPTHTELITEASFTLFAN